MKVSLLSTKLLCGGLFISIVSMIGCTAAKKTTSTAVHPIEGKEWQLPLLANKALPMEWISSGSFMMGSPVGEPFRKPDEGPQTKVTLTKGYWLGKTEFTVGDWKALTGESLREHVAKMLKDETVYDFGGQKNTLAAFMNFKVGDEDKIMANENDNLPMYFVSWEEAMELCKKLTAGERANDRLPAGYEYTLPTEAQWEYACRAGTTTAIFTGPLVIEGKNAPALNNYVWYAGNSAENYTGKQLGNSGAGPRNAGEKKANAWGLQDMSGNIWEWCRDWYGPYPGGVIMDPTGPASGTARVNKGGSWGSGANDSRSANRAANPQPEKSAYRGFRITLCAVQ